jgi:YebC/PmpR family DNA-binding regulatory protein
MAGHSHWAQIKRAKGAADAKRGQLFSKLAREISMAAKLGGGDPALNPRLRQAINNAKAESMPGDTIERAIKKGTGEIAGAVMEELTYEGYAPGGVAIIVQTNTDNKNRTAAEIRHIFTKHNGSLGTPGSVAWMFTPKGLITLEGDGLSEDAVFAAAIEAGGDDVRPTAGGFEVLCAPEKLYPVTEALRSAGLPVKKSALAQIPNNTMPVTDQAQAVQILKLLDALDEHEDVQNVFTNLEISEDAVAGLQN